MCWCSCLDYFCFDSIDFGVLSSYLPDLNLTLDLSAYGLAMYHFGTRDILEKLSPFMSEKILYIIKHVILIQTNEFLLLLLIVSSYFHCQSDIGIMFLETRWAVWRKARNIKAYR